MEDGKLPKLPAVGARHRYGYLRRFTVYTPAGNSFASVVFMLKRPEGRAPGGSVRIRANHKSVIARIGSGVVEFGGQRVETFALEDLKVTLGDGTTSP